MRREKIVGEISPTPTRVSGKATGSPVKVMAIVDQNRDQGVLQDDLSAGNRAAVQTINEMQNGLGGSGHPLELEIVETNLDPDRTAELARQAADDPSYVAIVGSLVTFAEVTPIFEKAGLPVIPAVPCAKAEYYSPVVFNTNGGHHVMCAGPLALAMAAGAKKTRTFTSVLVGMSWYLAVNQLIMNRLGLPEEREEDAVIAPLEGDITPYVAKAAEGGDAVICSLASEKHTVEAVIARKKLGITTPFTLQGMGVFPGMLEAMGAAGDGILVASLYPTPDSDLPGIKRYRASMHAAGHDKYVNDKSLMGWAAFDLLNYATQGMKTFDRSSVLNALRNVTDYTGGGLTPPLDFSQPKGPGAGYPRLYNWSYFPGKIENGKVVGENGLVSLPSDIPDVDLAFEGMAVVTDVSTV